MRNVLICGNPRSGTSFLAGVLEKAGYDIGKRAKQANGVRTNMGEEDRNEDGRVLELNFAAFRRMDAEPLRPDAYNPAWILEEQARGILDDKKAPWLIKDPAIAYTMPLWKEHFPDTVVAVSLRHPMACALSMDRFAVNVERGLKHWWGTYSNLLAFEHVYGPFCWVSFPSRNGMLQLWKALGVPPDTVTNGFKAEKVHYTEEAVPKGYEPLMQLHKSLEARIERGNDTL